MDSPMDIDTSEYMGEVQQMNAAGYIYPNQLPYYKKKYTTVHWNERVQVRLFTPVTPSPISILGKRRWEPSTVEDEDEDELEESEVAQSPIPQPPVQQSPIQQSPIQEQSPIQRQSPIQQQSPVQPQSPVQQQSPIQQQPPVQQDPPLQLPEHLRPAEFKQLSLSERIAQKEAAAGLASASQVKPRSPKRPNALAKGTVLIPGWGAKHGPKLFPDPEPERETGTFQQPATPPPQPQAQREPSPEPQPQPQQQQSFLTRAATGIWNWFTGAPHTQIVPQNTTPDRRKRRAVAVSGAATPKMNLPGRFPDATPDASRLQTPPDSRPGSSDGDDSKRQKPAPESAHKPTEAQGSKQEAQTPPQQKATEHIETKTTNSNAPSSEQQKPEKTGIYTFFDEKANVWRMNMKGAGTEIGYYLHEGTNQWIKDGYIPSEDDPKRWIPIEAETPPEKTISPKKTTSPSSASKQAISQPAEASSECPNKKKAYADAVEDLCRRARVVSIPNEEAAELSKTIKERFRLRQRVLQMEKEQKLAAEEAERRAEEEAKEQQRLAEQEAREQEAAIQRQLEEEAISKDREAEEAEAAAALARRVIQPLSPEWNARIDEALTSKDNRKVLALTVEGVELTRYDLGRVYPTGAKADGDGPQGWLNDETINGWFQSLVKSIKDQTGYVKGPNTVPAYEAFNSGWYNTVQKKGITGIETWSRRKNIKGEKLLRAEKIFFPINTGAHWTLLIISPVNKTIYYLDSLRGSGRKAFQLAREWLKMELKSKYHADEWTESHEKSEVQLDGTDCGVFACLNALAVAKGRSFQKVEADKMRDGRKYMIAVLMNGGFKGEFGFSKQAS